MSSTTYLVFVQTAPGLEPLLAEELSEVLGSGVSVKQQDGGVVVRVSREQLFRLCLGTRLAESVRVRLKSFIAREFRALEGTLGKLPWRAFLAAGSSIDVRVVCHRSRLWHTGAVTERVLAVLGQRFGLQPGRAEEGAAQVHLRITGDAVQASVDAGGYRLHRRGYRSHTLAASVRETLAAAAARQVLGPETSGEFGAKAGQVLWDPFCGAGTMALEALLLARGALAGERRSFAFESWPTHDAALFAATRDSARLDASARAPRPDLRAILSDRAAEALEAARHNTQSAGLSPVVEFRHGTVTDVEQSIPPGALVLTNPPYGRRLHEGGALESLLGVLERRPDLRPVVLLVGGAARKKLPPSFRAALRTQSGGQNVSVRVLGPGKF